MSESLLAQGQTRRLALYGTKGLVTRCRDFTREALADWGWTPAEDEEHRAVVDDVLLLVSEVVTNACLHADGPTELVLNCTDERLRIEVADTSSEHPRLRPPRSAALPGGHGLVVVQRLARRWGSAAREDGKTVWLEVASPVRGGAQARRRQPVPRQ
ncbi:ATP-binding protein [Streptomyces sp. A3M-1-3]|uniref:ATP-binding protein n=1 Tax=Streptomyces sp. A3M-1-3 TaxID=2962044 RepID=UPI0020B7C02D|nr:ATP-binding protein [Streptomyces sp. A3M-1-3]MCP3820671.1 ATP-binding protein [Streptomyces sp. A3M-1-3]